jgi:hypothetical protein
MFVFTKEARLVRALLEYAVDCLNEGDIESLRKLGFDRLDVERLSQLQLSDCRHFHAIHSHLLEVKIDRTRFHQFLDHLDHSRREAANRDYLVNHDAPLTLLNGLYGIDGKECALHRIMHGVAARVGRPREATAEQSQTVWAVYRNLGKNGADQMNPEDWVAVHQHTGVPLRIIWPLIKEWSTDAGHAPAEADDISSQAQGQE